MKCLICTDEMTSSELGLLDRTKLRKLMSGIVKKAGVLDKSKKINSYRVCE